MARSAIPLGLRACLGAGMTVATLPLCGGLASGCNCAHCTVLILALIGVGFLAGRDLEQRQQEVFPRRGVALVQRFVVPAAFAVAAGRDAGLLGGGGRGFSRGMGLAGGIFVGDHVV